MIGRVHQVNTSPGGVPKRPVPSAHVGRLGLEGDGHAEPEPVHGGPDKAVSIYGVEAIDRVAADGHAAFPGAFGENLTLHGIDLGVLRAGDRLRIGDLGPELELTTRAAPCQTIAHWFVDRRIARISPGQRPADARWYARVLREGRVAPGDRVEVVPSVAGHRRERAPGRSSPGDRPAAAAAPRDRPRDDVPVRATGMSMPATRGGR